MTNKSFPNIIPVLTTEAGRTLTALNWRDVGVEFVSLYLDELLLKPGYESLITQAPLSLVNVWKGHWVLNASLNLDKKQSGFTIRSPYDGAVKHFKAEDIFSLFQKLCPNILIMPEGCTTLVDSIWSYIPEQTLPFFYSSDVQNLKTTRRFGLYLPLNEGDDDLEQVKRHGEIPLYLNINAPLIILQCLTTSLTSTSEPFVIETNSPAQDAYLGTVYTTQGTISILDNTYAQEFKSLDEACACPTCKAGFSKAYLHHLYQHTPLLAQRYLIQHNVYFTMI